MKKILPCLFGPALVVGFGCLLCAQEATELAPSGTVLLLKSGQVMEGEIDLIGSQLRIRRGSGEVCIAADLAARLCADWDDAYAYMHTLIKDDSANDHVRLARWCNMHHLNEKALDEARIALRLQPDHAGAKQIVTLLERAIRDPVVKAAPAAAPAPPAAADKAAPAILADVNAETAIAFANKVQPILMNTCASCHATGGGGKFVLERVSEGGQKVATQHNLTAVLNFIDMDRPAISPLLVKAVTPHGAGAPPIKDRGAKPFVAIKTWLDLAIAKNPQLKDYHAAKKGAPAKSSDQPKSGFGTHQSSLAPASRETTVAERPVESAVMDEFDPRIFNDFYFPPNRPQQTANTWQR